MRVKGIFKNIYLALRRAALRLYLPCRQEDALPAEIKSILVIRLERIGDAIVSLPALKALKLSFPQAEVTVLVRQGNSALLSGIPWIDKIISYQGFYRTLIRLRRKRFDLAIDLLMDYPLKTALLAYLSGAGLTAGFDIEGRGSLFNLKFAPDSKNKHISQHILELVKMVAKSRSRINLPGEPFYAQLSIREENKEYIKSLLREKGIKEGDLLVGFHPGGHYPSQRWHIERFSQLADRITQRYKAKAVIIGSASEEKLVGRMEYLMREDALKFTGLSLDKVAGLISLMRILVCNNSGPLHIACALNIPTVSTMGPTEPALWCPTGELHIVARRKLSCSPCNRAVCKAHVCMELISVDEMMEAVDRQMENCKKAG